MIPQLKNEEDFFVVVIAVQLMGGKHCISKDELASRHLRKDQMISDRYHLCKMSGSISLNNGSNPMLSNKPRISQKHVVKPEPTSQGRFFFYNTKGSVLEG